MHTRWSRFHPYSHIPPSNIKILQKKVASRSSSLPSYQTDIDEIKGSKWNPIYVPGDDECESCHEEGHSVIVEGSKLKPIYVRGDDECEGCH